MNKKAFQVLCKINRASKLALLCEFINRNGINVLIKTPGQTKPHVEEMFLGPK